MAAAQPLKIRMVAGLGNPGDEYAETRHNAGFKAIDELARQAGVTYWKNQAGAEVALININDAEEENGKRQIVLVKPQSYMNTSGGPISKLCREYKIKAEELLVIHDELDIPAGDVRIKVGGGHAGHNGLRSIIDKMGSRDFSRIRTGIGNPPGKMAVADYVLKQLRAREAEDFQDTVAVREYWASWAVMLMITSGEAASSVTVRATCCASSSRKTPTAANWPCRK